MNGSIIVINVDIRETRVALIERGVITELQIERASHRGTVGNVVLGKVTRVLPGMQAAFIDVGQERSAFLHVEDLIRPDDFDSYLAGGVEEESGSFRGTGQNKGTGEVEADEEGSEPGSDRPAAVADDSEDDDPADDDSEDDDPAEDDPAEDDADEARASGDEDEEDDDSEGDDEDEDLLAAADEDEDEEEDDDDGPSAFTGASSEEEDEDSEQDDEAPDSEETLVSSPEPRGRRKVVKAAAGAGASVGLHEDSDLPAEGDRGGSRSGRSRRGRGSLKGGRTRRGGRRRGSGEEVASAKPKLVRGRRSARGGKGGRRSEAGTPARVTRSVPITEVVSEGDVVVVQISKEPIGTKGARVTSHVSLAGRYVVYLPTVDHLGISKRIGNARERSRLRKAMESLKPARGGLIVRTVAEGLTKKQLKADVGYLMRVWADICKKREEARCPDELYTELDLILKVARDLFTDEVKRIVIDDREQYARLVRFVEMFLPERVKDIELYVGEEPIFDAYGIEDEIGRALSRKVPLPSGGSLIVDQAEALTAIDVNTGRYVGKGSKDLEETALKTNLEAVEEIAYQLRFRNIGGLVILDLIDMERHGNREKVWRALETALVKDKAKTTLNRISELGLIEMTRKRTRESLGRVLHQPCFYCDGTGQIQSKATIAYEILRQIGRERHSLPGYSVVVNAHPAIVDFLKTDEKAAVEEAARRLARRIELTARPEYHIEQYDLHGR